MKKLLGAAALGCGIVFCAWAASPGEVLPASGPVSATTMQRLLLLDAERFGNRIVAVGDRGYIVLSDDHGAHWRRAKAPNAPLLTAIDFLDDQLGIVVGHDSVILASRDGGETWTARKITADDKHFNAILELGEGSLLILGEAGTILSSTDWGKHWSPLASPYKGSLFGALVTDDGAVVAFGMRGRIYRSTDKGKTWKQVDNPSTATLIGGEKLPDGAIVLAGSAGTALVSRDQGRSFVPITTGTTRGFAKPILAAPDALLLLGEAGARLVPFASGTGATPQQ